jgi:cytoskeletal protein CcmA (bactofilin family)
MWTMLLASPVNHAKDKLKDKAKGLTNMSQPSDFHKSKPELDRAHMASASGEQSRIGATLIIKGEITSSESLYIDGHIEGSLNCGENRVTVSSNGSVAANITAGEVVILGSVQGNVQCSDRLDIRSDGSLTGDVITKRISVEDQAILKGSVQVQAVERENDKSHRQTQQPKVSPATAGK